MNRKVIKSIGFLTTGNLGGALLSAVGGVLVARFIGPEVNGSFRSFTIPLMYITFLHLGTFDGLWRQIPFYIGRNQREYVEKIAAATGAWNIFITIIVSICFLSCSLWEILHGNFANAAGWLSQSFVCVGIYYGGYLGATYRTLNNFVALARIQFIQACIAFLLILAVALWGFYGLCLRVAIPAVVGVWLYHRARPLRVSYRWNFNVFKDVVKIGLPLCFWGTLDTSLWTAVEYSLMLHFAGVKGVGLFTVAAIMSKSLSILPQSANQVIMPRIIESYARERGVARSAKRTIVVSVGLALLMVFLILGISRLLDSLIPLLLPKYSDGLPLMKVYLGLAVLHAASLPFNSLVATGRSWLVGRGILAGFLAFPIIVYMLSPIIGGMLAVAAGSLAGRLVRIFVGYCDLFILMNKEVRVEI